MGKGKDKNQRTRRKAKPAEKERKRRVDERRLQNTPQAQAFAGYFIIISDGRTIDPLVRP